MILCGKYFKKMKRKREKNEDGDQFSRSGRPNGSPQHTSRSRSDPAATPTPTTSPLSRVRDDALRRHDPRTRWPHHVRRRRRTQTKLLLPVPQKQSRWASLVQSPPVPFCVSLARAAICIGWQGRLPLVPEMVPWSIRAVLVQTQGRVGVVQETDEARRRDRELTSVRNGRVAGTVTTTADG